MYVIKTGHIYVGPGGQRFWVRAVTAQKVVGEVWGTGVLAEWPLEEFRQSFKEP